MILPCSCPGGPHLGAHEATTPECCEFCGRLTQRQIEEIQAPARAAALQEAIDLLAAEARWQREMQTRHAEGAGEIAERVEMTQRILVQWKGGAGTPGLAEVNPVESGPNYAPPPTSLQHAVGADNGPWRDRHGDVWSLGADGLLWTPETAPFPRAHVEKKWGPLVPLDPTGKKS